MDDLKHFEKYFNDLCEFHLQQEEGKRLKAYKCTAGKNTIGIGFNFDAHDPVQIIGRKLTPTSTITDEECSKLFAYSLNLVMRDLDRNIKWWRTKPVAVMYVLVSLCFNLGISGLLKFKNTLALIDADKYQQAAENLKKSKWYTQVKTRGPKLVSILRAAKI